MNFKVSFGECLGELMKSIGLTNSKLAKGLSVDASLINKWINGKQVPPYKASYIDMATDFMMKSIVNSYQRDALIDTLNKYEALESGISDIDILKSIKKLLCEAQGCSIELKKSARILCKDLEPDDISSKESPCHSDLDSSCHMKSLDIPKIRKMPDKDVIQKGNIFAIKGIQVVTGEEKVLYAILHLMETAIKKRDAADEAILMTLTSDNGLPFENFEYHTRWKNALWMALKKGWSIIVLARLNNDNKRNLKIIEDILMYVSTGKYQVYYYTSCNENFVSSELVLVPGTGAFYCLSSMSKNRIDSSFFCKDQHALNILRGHFSQLFISAKPLLKCSVPVESVCFQKEYTETETSLGSRYCAKSWLSTLTLPIELYKRFLNNSSLSHEEITKKITFHETRVISFESQVKYFKFRDITLKETLEQMIREKTYTLFDSFYNAHHCNLSNKDIIDHLKHTIYLLKSYDNFEIAFADPLLSEVLPTTHWVVKENAGVLIISYFSDQINPNTDREKVMRGFTVSEPLIVKAFETHFNNLWERIDAKNKDKREVIAWFENQIRILS